jgi:hypothetical protein
MVKDLRQEVDQQVRVALALLDEGWAVDESAGAAAE